jgi:hypothetical protein
VLLCCSTPLSSALCVCAAVRGMAKKGGKEKGGKKGGGGGGDDGDAAGGGATFDIATVKAEMAEIIQHYTAGTHSDDRLTDTPLDSRADLLCVLRAVLCAVLFGVVLCCAVQSWRRCVRVVRQRSRSNPCQWRRMARVPL